MKYTQEVINYVGEKRTQGISNMQIAKELRELYPTYVWYPMAISTAFKKYKEAQAKTAPQVTQVPQATEPKTVTLLREVFNSNLGTDSKMTLLHTLLA